VELNILVLFTIFCWGIWGIFDKLALARASYKDVILILYIFYLPAIPVVYLILNSANPGWSITPSLVLWTGLAALSHTVAVVSYMHAMSKTEASYVLGITAAYPLVLQLLACVFLGESLVPVRLAGAALIGAGVFAIGLSTGERAAALAGRDRLVLWLCVAVATFCWGVVGLFDKKALATAHPLAVYLGQCLWDVFYLIVLVAYFKLSGHKPAVRCGRTWLFCGLSALCLMLGAWTFLAALAQASASYVIVITGAYPLLMYLFALLFLKERFNRARLAGIALVVAGAVLVQQTQLT